MPNEYLTPQDFSLVDDASLVGPVMDQAVKVNPDQQGKALQLSRKSGLDIDAVKNDPIQAEHAARLQEFDFHSFDKTPATEQHFADLQKASLSHDDVKNLSGLERALTPLAGLVQATMSLEEGAFRIPGFVEDVTSLVAQNAETLGVPRAINPIRAIETLARGARYAADPYAKQFKKAQETLPDLGAPFRRTGVMNAKGDVAFDKAIGGDFGPILDVLTDPEAISTYASNMVPSLLVALATGGSYTAIGAMEGSSELTSQAQTGKELPLGQKVQATLQVGIINGMLEKIGVDYLRKFPVFQKFFKEADLRGVNLSDIVKTALVEGGQETLQQFNQNVAQAITYNPEQSLTSGVLQSAIGGGAGGVGFGAFGYVESRAYKKAETAAFNVKEQENPKDQSIIDKINHYAKESLTRKRDPQTFREFVQGIDKDSNVYIEGEQITKYLQSKSDDEIDASPALQMLLKAIQESQTLKTDVGIPVADFATDIAGTEHFDALRPHMKIDPESATPFRATEVETEMKSYVDRLMTEAKDNTSMYTEAQDIFTSVRDQLIDTGRMTPQQAGVAADLVPAWATVQAKNRGIPVAQVYAESGLKIEGPMTGKADELSAETLKQTDTPKIFRSGRRTPQAEQTDNASEQQQQAVRDAYDKEGTQSLSSMVNGELPPWKYKSPLEQPARGYYDPSNSLIRLTEASNLSTFLHEFAHFMYDMEKKNPNSQITAKIHQWFKRNAEDVAAEANGYIGMEGRPIEQLSASDRFYSQLRNAIEGAPDKVFSKGKMVAQWIQSNASKLGIKKDELFWTGITDWLETQPKVTKADVLAYLDANGVQVQDVTLGEPKMNMKSKYMIPEVRKLAQQSHGTADEAFLLTLENDGDIYRKLTTKFPELANDEDWGRTVMMDVFGQTNPDTPKFGSYQLPGGENYKELLLTLPDAKMPLDIKQRDDGAWGLFVDGKQIGAPYPTEMDARIAATTDQRTMNQLGPARYAKNFRSSHYDTPNILAHIRFNERTDADGKRVLFLEEIQSDWGQKGKKVGFASQESLAKENERRKNEEDRARRELELVDDIKKHERDFQRAASKAGENQSINTYLSVIEKWANTPYKQAAIDAKMAHQLALEKQRELQRTIDQNRQVQSFGIPPAPFVTDTKSWTALALKRMIRYAAENGFDKIAWTTGEQQADRYSLAKQIDSLMYAKRPDGTYQIKVVKNSGDAPTTMGSFAEKDLEDNVGKEIAKKIVAGEGRQVPHSPLKHLENVDLKVGGEGMKGYYDQIVPQVANDILKKLGGGKVEQINLGDKVADASVGKSTDYRWYHFDARGYMDTEQNWATEAEAKAALPKSDAQQGFTITPELKSKVMESGLPLFQGGINKQPSNETFFSPLQRAVEKMQMGKGSPEQWQGVVKNLTQKGVKMTEINATGVLDWLEVLKNTPDRVDEVDASGALIRSYPAGTKREDVPHLAPLDNPLDRQLVIVQPSKSVTKADVLEYIKGNAVIVKPVIRGGPRHHGDNVRYDSVQGDSFDFRWGDLQTVEEDRSYFEENARDRFGEDIDDIDTVKDLLNLDDEEEISELVGLFDWMKANPGIRTYSYARELPSEYQPIYEKIIEKYADREERWYYEDSDSPTERTITVEANGTYYDFYWQDSYGEQYLRDEKNGREVDLPRRADDADDADIEGAIRVHLAEKYDEHDRSEEVNPEDGNFDQVRQFIDTKWEQFVIPGGTDYQEREIINFTHEGDDFYYTTHFPEKNIIGFHRGDMREVSAERIKDSHPDLYARVTAEGRNFIRVRFIQEIQSDWAQKGGDRPEVRRPYKPEEIILDQKAEAEAQKIMNELKVVEIHDARGPEFDSPTDRFWYIENTAVPDTEKPVIVGAIAGYADKESANYGKQVLAGANKWIFHDTEGNKFVRSKDDYATEDEAKKDIIEQNTKIEKGTLTQFEITQRRKELGAELDKAHSATIAARQAIPDEEQWDDVPNTPEGEKFWKAKEAEREIQDQLDSLPTGDKIDTAEFVTSTDAWVSLLIKDAIRDAVEQDADLIAWTTGEQQVERWSGGLRSRVDKISWEKTEGGKIHIIASKGDRQLANTHYTENDLAATIGKTMGNQIITDPNQSGEIKGEDIIVADLGMTKFYGDAEGNNPDGKPSIVTKNVNKIIKDLGSKGKVTGGKFNEFKEIPGEPANIAEENKLKYLNKYLSDQPSFEITPEMAAKVKEGLPLFQGGINKQQGQIVAQNVVDYLDNGTSGDATKDAAIERAVHEQFARGFEKYLMEGNAPSVELRNIFRTFARWLVQVYKSIKGDLQVNLDDEMRKVFASMIATEEQIAAAEARAHFEPMFTDAAMAGMTEEEFTAYKARQEKVVDKATETLREKLIKQITRQTENWWKEELDSIVNDEETKLRRLRVYLGGDTLRKGNIKLDTAAVKEKYSEVRTDKLGRKMTHIPKQLTGMVVSGGEGVHPDVAAATLGYSSGDEMIQDLMTAKPIKQLALENAQQQMLDKHGDILTDGTIEREADEAMLNEERGKMILAELKALNKGTSKAAIQREALSSLAEDAIGKQSFREIQPAKYRNAEIRAAQESASLLASGDKVSAAEAKLRQAMNYYLSMAATNAKNDTLKIVDRMARYRRKSVMESIQRAEGGYWDQLAKILNRFDFRKSATLKGVDKKNESINTWMKRRIEENGDALMLTPAVLDEGYITHWKNVSYGELVGISDSIKNIEHVARYSNKITRMQEEMEFQQLVQQWVDSMNSKVKTKFVSQRTSVIEGRNWGRWAMAQMTKIPYLASWLDGGERAGISHDILVQPFVEAYDEEMKLWREIGTPVLELISGRDKADIKRHNQKLFIPEIKDARNDGNLFGHQVVAVALNTGNQSNLKKMLLGEGWATEGVDDTINNPKLQAVLKHMTKTDWDLVQAIWDQMDKLYPQLAEVHRRTTGLTPPKVEAVPVKTPFGTYSGGYYPVKYDPNRSFRAEKNQERLDAQTESMFGQVGIQASVNASATNERTGYYAPIRLSLDVVPNHFQETIHYITHHDAVREVNKLLRNETVANTIKEKLGPEEFAQLKPWLNDIAKDGREAPMKMWWESVLQRLRFGVTLGVMGFKASTGLMQLLGLSNTVAEVGSANTLQAVRSILGSPQTMQDAWDFAVANSKVMNHRADTMDREIKNAMQKIEGKHGFMAAVQEASMKHIALIQTYMVDLPSWHAAYIKGMKQWGDEKRAYKYADWVVENIQGSGTTMNMAQVMRNQSQANRMFTMFMTFFSSLWNMERDVGRGATTGYYSKTTVAAKMMFILVIPVFLEMLLRGDWGDDKDKDTMLQRYLTNLALYPTQSVPFLRDIVSGGLGDYGYNISPVAQLIEQGTVAIPKIATAPFTDKEITKSNVKGATKFIGATIGIPGVNQMWSTGEHLEQVIVDGEDLTLKQLLYGPTK